MNPPKTKLIYGPDSTRYENGLVGNCTGLIKLKDAIDEALSTGSSSAESIGDLGQIFCEDDDFFPPEEPRELGWR